MKEPDFTGWATRANLKCTDGRTIMPDAFKHQDKAEVPLVWQHGHGSTENILGHAVLENRPEGVYCKAYFNDTPSGQNAKKLVQHKDVKALSIYANQLVEKSKAVLHGMIKEVSLVLSGANPGALIDYVQVAHSDGAVDILDDEAVIYTGLSLEHADSSGDSDNDGDTDANPTDGDTVEGELSVEDVYNSMTDEQKAVVGYMVGAALEDAGVSHSDEDDEDADADESDEDEEDEDESSEDESDEDESDEDNDNGGDLDHMEGNQVMNVFDQTDSNTEEKRPVLSHAQMTTILEDAKRIGSFKEAVLAHVDDYGIGNVDLLFPPEKAVTSTPEFIARRTAWVNKVMTGVKALPFTRIKSLFADITADEARAKGYLKGNMKKDEFFQIAKRTTSPATIYKKQKLDRDDILDITDFDVVTWLQGEMRLMLDEEIAGAILVGDGREADDPDKVLDPAGSSSGPGIRSIANDNEFYAFRATVNSQASGYVPDDLIDAVVNAMADYQGSGSPTLFIGTRKLNTVLLQKDTLGRRLYEGRDEIAQLMGVGEIVDVPDVIFSRGPAGLIAIVVNLTDYAVGTDQGGQVSMFDFFDIDFNQNKYLLEGRSSGALTKYRSAINIFDSTTATNLIVSVTPPSFNAVTGVVTIPTQSGVVYSMDGTTVSAGAQTAIAAGDETLIEATPASGYEFGSDVDHEWLYQRNA